MEQVDFSHREENLPSPPVQIGALDCSIMLLLLQRGAGWGVGETASIRTHNTHQANNSTALTWSPPNGSFLAAAETDFAEDPQEMSLAKRAGVFARAGATFRSRNPVAVRLPRLAFLPDQGAGDRGHLPEPSLKTESLVRQWSDPGAASWRKLKKKKDRVDSVFRSTSVSTKCHPDQKIFPVPGIIALLAASS